MTFPKRCLQIFKCVSSLPWPRRVCISPRKFMRIHVKREELALEGIGLLCVSVEEERKLDTPGDQYETLTITQIILYRSPAVVAKTSTAKFFNDEKGFWIYRAR